MYKNKKIYKTTKKFIDQVKSNNILEKTDQAQNKQVHKIRNKNGLKINT